MASSKPSPFQREVRDALFAREQGLFLTGGAALGRYHFGHRTTDELDFVTRDVEAFGRSCYVMESVAADLGARLDVRRDAPGFRRYALSHGDETVVVDAVQDRSARRMAKKPRVGAIVGSARGMSARSSSTLPRRSSRTSSRQSSDEWRSVISSTFCSLNDRVIASRTPFQASSIEKDGGCTPATLAWLLSQIEISGDVTFSRRAFVQTS